MSGDDEQLEIIKKHLESLLKRLTQLAPKTAIISLTIRFRPCSLIGLANSLSALRTQQIIEDIAFFIEKML